MSEDIIVKRPWGQYQKICQEGNYWVKRVQVDVGHRISLQKHKYRSEKIIVVSGKGLITIKDVTTPMSKGEVFAIPQDTRHRIAAFGHEPLIFLEIAQGEHLTENDIKIYADDYRKAFI